MTQQQKPSKALHIALWAVQAMLSATLIWAASMKLFRPAVELVAKWPWTADHPGLVKFTGIVDLLAGLGLLLPGMLRVAPKLTAYAAFGTIALMIAACIFHVSRGEGSQTGINLIFALLAAFIAWGRLTKAPLKRD